MHQSSSYTRQMKVANLSVVKNELSRFVEHARTGGRVRILVSGVPAADLVPIEPMSTKGSDDLEELERSGSIRRGKEGLARKLLEPGPPASAKAVRAAIAEERDGR
jgi:prevent-host-death family protein